jgi:copper resistance protein B
MRARVLSGLASLSFAILAGAAHAQMAHGGGPASEAAPFGAPVPDQHVWAHVILDQLEARIGPGQGSLRWDGEAWAGPDEWRVRLRSEGERAADGKVEDGQTEILYSKPIATFWDVQLGGRYDLDSGPGRGWVAAGIEGLAPGFFNVAATAYAGGQGRTAAKLKVSYDQLLTNRLILQPEAEVNLYGRSDPARRIGSGVSDLDAGLRLRYEISRKFAPYVGVTWAKKFGTTADLARRAGESTDDVRLAVGLRTWF